MKFTPQIADHILMQIADGESLRRICQDDALPSRQTVLRWLWGESQEAEAYDFVAKYARAREAQADAMDDRILDVADSVTPESAPADRIRLAALQWRASKLAPKKYGDRLTHDGDANNPIAVAVTHDAKTLARAMLATIAKAETDDAC